MSPKSPDSFDEPVSEATDQPADADQGLTLGRRSFVGGAAALGAVSAAAVLSQPVSAATATGSFVFRKNITFRPLGAQKLNQYPQYRGDYNLVNRRPFGGFKMAIGYIAEGIDAMDPEQDGPNPSGLFESFRDDIASGVGGNETEARSAEYWFRGVLKWSNQTIANDIWSFINYARRQWGLDFDNPASDGFLMPSGLNHSYRGSPDPEDELSLWSPRVAIDGKGGFARMTPTLLAPSFGYTVVFQAGRGTPNYQGGTTAGHPEDPAKVRDGGIWGGIQRNMDVLDIIQDAAAGNLTYTTPDGPSTNPAQWGQFWRNVAHLDDVDVDAVDPSTPVSERPAPRPGWPLGYLEAGNGIFWGSYNLNMGRRNRIDMHYESLVLTRFRDPDGIAKSFLCELIAHPGGTDMPADQIAAGLKDVDGSLGGFPDVNDPTLNGMNPFGLGRVHGTAVPEGITADGYTTYHLRNWLLFPPTLNSIVTQNNSVPGKGILESVR